MAHRREASLFGNVPPTTVTPEFTGQIYYDTVAMKYYGSRSKTTGDWVLLGDMLKSVYDADNDTLVDNAEQLNDGTNVVTAAEIRNYLDNLPDIQKDDVDVVTDFTKINFEGNVNVIDEGSGKSTVTILGSGGTGFNNEVCYNISHINDKKGFFAVSKLKEKYTFIVPDNFISLVSLDIIFIPKDTKSSGKIDLRSNYGKISEDYDHHSETVNDIPITTTKDIISTFDISPVFSSLEAGDHCGVKIKDNGTGDIYVICIRLRYN